MAKTFEYCSQACYLDFFPELRATVTLAKGQTGKMTVRFSDPNNAFHVDMTLEQAVDLMEKIGRVLIQAGSTLPPVIGEISAVEDIERAIVDIQAGLTLLQNAVRPAPEAASKDGE